MHCCYWIIYKFLQNLYLIFLQNGGGCDQNPVSVHTILASPTNKWPSLQLNVNKAPTAYFRWLADALVPSIWPLIGTNGWEHWIAKYCFQEEKK